MTHLSGESRTAAGRRTVAPRLYAHAMSVEILYCPV